VDEKTKEIVAVDLTMNDLWVRNVSVIVLERGEWHPSEDVPEPVAPQEVPPS